MSIAMMVRILWGQKENRNEEVFRQEAYFKFSR